jgi:hypothetical protein
LNDVITKNVIDALGQPGNLFKVQVKRLWDDHYRVNVLVGPDAASVLLAHSYFLVADAGGRIVSSEPRIERRY